MPVRYVRLERKEQAGPTRVSVNTVKREDGDRRRRWERKSRKKTQRRARIKSWAASTGTIPCAAPFAGRIADWQAFTAVSPHLPPCTAVISRVIVQVPGSGW